MFAADLSQAACGGEMSDTRIEAIGRWEERCAAVKITGREESEPGRATGVWARCERGSCRLEVDDRSGYCRGHRGRGEAIS